jgi:hypothetical protein
MVKGNHDRGKHCLCAVPWQTLHYEDCSDVIGRASRRLDGRLALFPWQNRAGAFQLAIALTHPARLSADMLDQKRSAYSVRQ